MTVTDILQDDNIYTDHWLTSEETPPKDTDEEIEKYNKNRGRFLFYAWGVYVTAFARARLFTAIIESGVDYAYSDTDGVKIQHAEKHAEYFERYNAAITEELKTAMEYHKLPIELTAPLTKDGIKKPLGVWDFDGHYTRFKSLGAKRYLVEYSNDARNGKNAGKINLTVAGLAKQTCVPYMCRGWCYDRATRTEHNSPFDFFRDGMYIPPEYTGKMTHIYIDETREGFITDYRGERAPYKELSAVHLENADYSLSMAREFVDYIMGVQQIE